MSPDSRRSEIGASPAKILCKSSILLLVLHVALSRGGNIPPGGEPTPPTPSIRQGQAGPGEYQYRGLNGPEFWNDISAFCAGKKQSPINVDTSIVKPIKSLKIQFSEDYFKNIKGTLFNNGKGVEFTPDPSSKLTIQGGPLLEDTYVMAQFHFHWGSSNDLGSEHTINHHRFPLELHLVHRNSKYPDLGAAVSKEDGLAVIGFLFEIDPYPNSAGTWRRGFAKHHTLDETFASSLGQIESNGKEVQLQALNISTLGCLHFKEYYHYTGSLTTPTCNEGVKWILAKTPSYVNQQIMDSFRSLFDKNPENRLSDNFRVTQPLNGRNIYEISTVPDREELLGMVKGSIDAIDVMNNGSEPFSADAGQNKVGQNSTASTEPATTGPATSEPATIAPNGTTPAFNEGASKPVVFQDGKANNPKLNLKQAAINQLNATVGNNLP